MSFFRPIRRYTIRGEYLLEPPDSLAASAIELAAEDDSIVELVVRTDPTVVTVVGTDDFKAVSPLIEQLLAPSIAENNALHG